MHALWTPSWYPTPSSPLNGSFFAEQKQMLEASGITVGIITLQTISFWQERDDLHVTNRVDDVFRRSVRTIPLGVIPGDQQLIAAQARKVGREYQDAYGVPDIIHAHSVFPGLLVAQALGKMWNIPFGFTEHRPSSLERRTYGPRYRTFRKTLLKSSFNTTVSEEMAEKLTAYYQVPAFEAVALPCRPEFFEAPLHHPSEGVFTFLHVSSMDDNKRTAQTIAAFAQVLRMHAHIKLLLVGGTPELIAEHTAYAHSLNIPHDAVEFTGPVPREQIVTQMNRGDCLVLVSATESAGLVFAEAQSLGIPVIASATAGGKFMTSPEVGHIVPIDDQGALVSAMSKVLERSAAKDIFPQKIRDYAASRFSVAAFSARCHSLYSKAISS